jgi:alanyl-tRNA synthetase
MAAVGVERLEIVIENLLKAGADTIPGIEIFKLYDTFGFPLDFTKEIADEKAMKLDMAGFDAELEKQRERARQSWKGDEGGVSPLFQKFTETGGTQFLGYQAIQSAGRVLGIIKDNALVDAVQGAEQQRRSPDQTPFARRRAARSATPEHSSGTRDSSRLDTYAGRGVIVHKVGTGRTASQQLVGPCR